MKALFASLVVFVTLLAALTIYGGGDPFTDPSVKRQLAEMEENQARWNRMSLREKAKILAQSPHRETALQAWGFLAGKESSPFLESGR